MLDLPLARRSRLVGKPQLARRPSLAGEKPWWQPNSRVEIAKRDNVFTARALKQIIAELPTVGRVHKHVCVLAGKLAKRIDLGPRMFGLLENS